MGVGEIAPASIVTFTSVVVDRTVAGVEDQLQERMWVGMVCAGTHLHGEQQEENETKNEDERGQPTRAAGAGPGCE